SMRMRTLGFAFRTGIFASSVARCSPPSSDRSNSKYTLATSASRARFTASSESRFGSGGGAVGCPRGCGRGSRPRGGRAAGGGRGGGGEGQAAGKVDVRGPGGRDSHAGSRRISERDRRRILDVLDQTEEAKRNVIPPDESKTGGRRKREIGVAAEGLSPSTSA